MKRKNPIACRKLTARVENTHRVQNDQGCGMSWNRVPCEQTCSLQINLWAEKGGGFPGSGLGTEGWVRMDWAGEKHVLRCWRNYVLWLVADEMMWIIMVTSKTDVGSSPGSDPYLGTHLTYSLCMCLIYKQLIMVVLTSCYVMNLKWHRAWRVCITVFGRVSSTWW